MANCVKKDERIFAVEDIRSGQGYNRPAKPLFLLPVMLLLLYSKHCSTSISCNPQQKIHSAGFGRILKSSNTSPKLKNLSTGQL